MSSNSPVQSSDRSSHHPPSPSHVPLPLSAAPQQPTPPCSPPTASPTVAPAGLPLGDSLEPSVPSVSQLGEIRLSLIELLKPLFPADPPPYSPSGAINSSPCVAQHDWLALLGQHSPDTTLLKQKLYSDRISRPLLEKTVDLIVLLTQLVETSPSTTFSTEQILWKRIETVCVRAMALCKSHHLAHSDIESIMAAVERLNNLSPNLDAQRWSDFSRADDELVGQIQRLSRWRMEDQRAEMPALVAQGVAAMGWLSRPAPRDPEMEAFMDQLERAGDRRMLNQCADRRLSALMVAYRASMVETEATERALARPSVGRKAQQDTGFPRSHPSVSSVCSEAEALHSDDEDEHTGLITGPVFRRHRSPSAVLASKWNMFTKLVGGPEAGRRASVDPSAGWGRTKPRVALDGRRASEGWTGQNMAVA